MYNLSDIREIHLEVTSNCQAKCPMCARRINGGPMNPFVEINEITLEVFKNWFNTEFIRQLQRVFFCGNLGDPIVARDTLEIIKYLRQTNPTIDLSMHTNASARDSAWWQKLAGTGTRVVFAIDGLADTHALYRIDTQWDKIIDNAKSFISSGGYAEWHMLAFEHNEHQIDECRTMSDALGFKKFNVKHTSRFAKEQFNVLDDSGRTIHLLRPTTRSRELTNRVAHSLEQSHTISCKSLQGSQIYVAASGIVTPCCWLDLTWAPTMHESRIDYMDKVGHFPTLREQSLTSIFESGYFDTIEKTWTSCALRECSKQCGNFNKLAEQFKEA